jgi:hypothetical protein
VLLAAPHLKLDWVGTFKMGSRQEPIGRPIERLSTYCLEDITWP